MRNPVAKNVNRVHKPHVERKEVDPGPQVCDDCDGEGGFVCQLTHWGDTPSDLDYEVCETCGGLGYV